MKRTIRLIATILMLAIVVSVLAVLPAFAEDSGNTDRTVRATWSDILGTNTGSNKPTVTSGETDDGIKYQQLSGNEAYDAANSPSSNYIAMSGTSSIIIQDYGTKTKNTSYMIWDFDISTDSTLIDGLYFHTRWKRADGVNDQGNNYLEFEGTTLDELRINTTKAAYNCMSMDDNTNAWRNVTIVYDFTTIKTLCGYVYIDGVYCGDIQGLDTTAACYLYFIRLCFPVQDDSTANIKFANSTISTFDQNYNGIMNDDGVLRNVDVTLDQIPELAYTLENLPGEQEDVYASVERGEETINLYDIYDIDSFKFENGDKLVFHKSEANEVILPSDIEITVVDTEGTAIESSTLVSVPTISRIDYAATQWIIRDRLGAVSSRGPSATTIYTNKEGKEYTVDTSTSLFNSLVSTETQRVTLLSDVITYGGSAIKSVGYGKVDVDLNGYTLTVDPGCTHLFNFSHNNGRIQFREGNLIHAGGGNNLLFANGGTGAIIFKDMDTVTVNKGSVMIDQRLGTVYFKNVKDVKAIGDLCSTKSYAGRVAYFYMVGCTVDVSGAEGSLFYSGNVATGGKSQGSHTNYFVVRDSDITYNGQSVFNAVAYAAETDYADQLLNNNLTSIVIENSTIKSDFRLIDVSLSRLNEAMTSFNFDVNIEIKNSTIGCSSLASTINGSDINSSAVPFTSDANITVDANSSISAYNALAWNRGTDDNLDEGLNISLSLADGVKLGYNKVDRDDSFKAAAITLGDGTSAIAGTSLGGDYPFVVTPDYTTYTYTDINGETGTFPWAIGAGEVVNASTFAPLPETTDEELYIYEWIVGDGTYTAKLSPTFKFYVNLTLYHDIYLNAFVEVVDADKFNGDNLTVMKGDTLLTRDVNYVITDYTDENGNKFFKVQILGITPDEAADDYTIVANFTETAKVGKSISVLEYLERGYADNQDYFQTIFNYLATVNPALTSDDIKATTPDGGEYKAPTEPEGVTVSLNITGDFGWILEDLKTDKVTATYKVNGEVVEKELKVDGNKAAVNLKACDLLDDVTFVIGEGEDAETVTVSFTAYAALVIADPDHADYKTIIDAIYDYASASRDYKNENNK